MSSCVKPKEQLDACPLVLLHGFDRFGEVKIIRSFQTLPSFMFFVVHHVLSFSSCLEWRYTLPMLEEAGLETWAIDVLGWGFSDLGIFLDLAPLLCFSLLGLLKLFGKLILVHSQYPTYLLFLPCILLEKLPPCSVASKRDHLYQVRPPPPPTNHPSCLLVYS